MFPNPTRLPVRSSHRAYGEGKNKKKNKPPQNQLIHNWMFQTMAKKVVSPLSSPQSFNVVIIFPLVCRGG